MTTKMSPTNTTEHPIPSNMALLVAAIEADSTLGDIPRRDMASAVRRLAKGLGMKPAMVPTDPAALRPLLANFPAAKAGVSTGNWRNIRTGAQRALAHVGLTTVPGRSQAPLSPGWEALLAGLPTYGARYKLGRFGRYCGAAGIEPDGVDDSVLAGYLDELRVRSLVAEPERLHRDVIIAWNRCRLADPGWPQAELTVPDNRDIYALPWETFPASLKADVDAWIDWLAGTDPMAERDFKPLRPASLDTRMCQMHLFVSAIVLRGRDPQILHTLADVVVPEHVADGLRFFWERAGNQRSLHAGQIAGMICSVARNWVKSSETDLKRLSKMAANITPDPTGMTKRNRDRLRPLADPERLRQLLRLPGVIRQEVELTGAPTRSLALQMQTAVAIELVIVAPMRIKNLASLRIGTHLLRGRRGDWTLLLPEDEVKNGVPLEVPLPDATGDLLDLYLSEYWPLLGCANSDPLFPGRTGVAPKCTDGLRQQISTCLLTRCGLKMHPHIFRHLAGMIILNEHPGAYGQVQRVLGHKNINTVMNTYTGMEVPAAFKHYDELVEKLRDESDVPSTKPARRKTTKKSAGKAPR